MLETAEIRELSGTVDEMRAELEDRLLHAMAVAKDTPEHAAVGAVVDAWKLLDATMREGNALPSAWL